MLANPAIIRHRLKIQATIHNAKLFLEIKREFGSFADYLWGLVGYSPQQREIRSNADYRAISYESDALAKDLKRRGCELPPLNAIAL